MLYSIEVTIGEHKLRTSKQVAERFAKRVAPFFTPATASVAEFVDTQEPEELIGGGKPV